MTDEFYKAVNYVNAMKDNVKVTDNLKEELYGLFKSVTVGKCSEKGGSRPMFYNVVAQRKYDAWMRYDNKEVDECIKEYISIVNSFRL
jgi:acyl-CoA-binding protein